MSLQGNAHFARWQQRAFFSRDTDRFQCGTVA